ncbi:zinc-binding dehydrogenase [Comamonas sp. Y33R10-2]|uniref:zinc-binding dehydrogenase n=1 Tax=Comamonas sp. Y33R10-2 TaxID=2853257 RepID=UPI002106073F|nr:zinc-binding dehydrogenase [Comamonas sp. Y33R10-2]
MPFRIEEVQIDGPGPGEVLVQVRAAGLCHSDLSVLEGLRKRPLPIVGGHEGAGVVMEVGAGVVGLSAGDHVAMAAVAGCGRCRVCSAGRPGLCQAVTGARAEGLLATGARRLHLGNGDRLNHYSGISVYAEYAVVAAPSLVRIDRRVPLDIAAMFGCAVVTGAGAVFNSAKVRSGSSVAVVGLGGVGLTAVMAAREAGASRIVGLDIQPDKFALARAAGATDCVDAHSPEAVQHVRELTDGGVDYSFEISGNLAAVGLAQEVTARGGEVICVGVGRTDAQFTVQQMQLVTEERVIRGSFMGGGIPQQDIPRFAAMYLDGKLPVDLLRSKHIQFAELNHGFDLLAQGGTVRQILLPHGVV